MVNTVTVPVRVLILSSSRHRNNELALRVIDIGRLYKSFIRAFMMEKKYLTCSKFPFLEFYLPIFCRSA
jgi:hypothetical protein